MAFEVDPLKLRNEEFKFVLSLASAGTPASAFKPVGEIVGTGIYETR